MYVSTTLYYKCNRMGYMFRLYISHPQAHFCQVSHKVLCTLRDPIVHDGIPECA